MLKHVFLLIAILIAPTAAFSEGKCEFFVQASNRILEFTGSGCTIEGAPKIEQGKVSGEFSVDLSKIDTGIGFRNNYIHNTYLETKKYPKALLSLDPMPEAGGNFTGKLNLHGIEKQINGTAEKSSTGYSFEFLINTNDFGIKQAEYKGIVIGENVSVFGSI
jgi:polyisoprenoid-binding protein YceI